MARQTEVPGTERKTIPEVTAAAETYRVIRDKRIALSAEEKAAKTTLIEVMRKHKLAAYVDENSVPPLSVFVTDGAPDVKVKDLAPSHEDSEPEH